MPQGGDLYAYLTRRFTTTDLTPQQIHEKGLSEVARIRREMETIMKKVGFEGTLPEFFTKLRTDPASTTKRRRNYSRPIAPWRRRSTRTWSRFSRRCRARLTE